jgi:hemolysin D
VVQQLAVHSVRGVVTPAETLMVIVPDRRRLVVEAMVANRDIGFAHAGQAVNVKVAAFPFTRFGLVPGRVLSVSRDSLDDTPVDTQDIGSGDKTKNTAPQGTPDLDGGESRGYVATIALDRDTVRTPNGDARLQSGMSVTAEIRTGARRVISYLLSPVIRYTGDAGHER